MRKEAGSRPLRLLDVEGLLTPFAGLGVDAVTLQHYNELKAKMSQIPIARRFASGGPTRMVAMSTIPYWGFGARIFPYANEREGLFSLRVVDIGSLDVVLNIRSIWSGSYRSDRVHDFLVEAVRIEYERPMPLQIGGDPVGAKKITHAAIADRPIRVVDYYSPPQMD